MADGIHIDIDGIVPVVAALTDHSVAAVAKGQLVVRAAAEKVVATAQQLVPVDTGATKGSIHATILHAGTEAEIGPTTSYAPYLEFGTVKMSPRAFMGPALDHETPGFLAAVEAIADGL